MSGLSPTGEDSTRTINEDEPYVFSASDFGYFDPEGDPFFAVEILSISGGGTFTLNNVTFTGGPVYVHELDDGDFYFTPAANASGNTHAGFQFQVRAEFGDPDDFPNAFTFHVDAVADAPTAANGTAAFSEDQTYTFGAGDFNFSDPDSGVALHYVKIVTLPGSGTLYYSGVAVAADVEIAAGNIALLTFVPATNANGNGHASFTFQVSDGTSYSDDTYTMTIDIAAVNDQPTAENISRTIDEDSTYTFTLADFSSFADADTGEGLQIVRFESNQNGEGRFFLSGVEQTVWPFEATRADINAGLLIFKPSNDENGADHAIIDFRVGDGTSFSADAYLLTFSVTPVNDTPVDIALSSSSIAEFRATNTVVGVLSSTDVDAGDSFTYTLLGNAGGRFMIVGNQLRVADGLLCDFEQDSTHTVQVRVTDSGGLTFVKDFNLTLTNVNPEVITGNSAANVFWGGALADTFNGLGGNDELRGNGGNDVLNGGTNVDTMLGGDGNDTYHVDAAGDITTETNASLATGGNDLVNSSLSRILGANLEMLTLTGGAAANGTGNTLANVITGNAGVNVINGMAGNDTLRGNGGNDFFVFNTALSSTLNKDVIFDFNVTQDTIKIESAIFAAIGQAFGVLAAGRFWKSATGLAHDGDDRIIYETDTGLLRYDSNGSAAGGAGPIIFADLAGGLLITNTDFLVI